MSVNILIPPGHTNLWANWIKSKPSYQPSLDRCAWTDEAPLDKNQNIFILTSPAAFDSICPEINVMDDLLVDITDNSKSKSSNKRKISA